MILAHNYQTPEIFHGVADIMGDSLALAQQGGEDRRRRDRAVRRPLHGRDGEDPEPGEDGADPRPRGRLLARRVDHRRRRAPAARSATPACRWSPTSTPRPTVKAESDICCTSANAVRGGRVARRATRVIFLPDEYLGKYVAAPDQGRDHPLAGPLRGARALHRRGAARATARHTPGVQILAHPECPPDVLAEADFVGSTAGMIRHVGEAPPAARGDDHRVLDERQRRGRVPGRRVRPPLQPLPAHEAHHPAQDPALAADHGARGRGRPDGRRPAPGWRSSACSRSAGGEGERTRCRAAPSGRVDGVARSDVVVVGAGVAGLSAALGCAPLRVHRAHQDARSGTAARAPGRRAASRPRWARTTRPRCTPPTPSPPAAGLADPRRRGPAHREGPERDRAAARARRALRPRRRAAPRARPRGGAQPPRASCTPRDATGAEMVRALVGGRAPARRTVRGGRRAPSPLDLVVDDGAGRAACWRAHADGAASCSTSRPPVVLATGGIGQLYLAHHQPAGGDRRRPGDGRARRRPAGRPRVRPVPSHGARGRAPTRCRCSPRRCAARARSLRRRARASASCSTSTRTPSSRRATWWRAAIWRHLARRAPRLPRRPRRGRGRASPSAFPTVFALCQRHGLDPRREPIPVAPAAHYHMGGIAVDARRPHLAPRPLGLRRGGVRPASTAPTGWPATRCSKPLVFGARVARRPRWPAAGRLPRRVAPRPPAPPPVPGDPARRTTACGAARCASVDVGERRPGARRSAGWTAARRRARGAARRRRPTRGSEPRNLVDVGRLVAAAALARTREPRQPLSASTHPSAATPAWQSAARLRRLAATLADGRPSLPLHPLLYEAPRRGARCARTSAAPATSPPTPSSPRDARAAGDRRRARRPARRRAGRSRCAPSGCSIRDVEIRRVAVADGDDVAAGRRAGRRSRAARGALLTAERMALNLLGRLCGIATATRDLVAAVAAHAGARRLHPQDDARPARAREVRGARAAAGRTTASASTTRC